MNASEWIERRDAEPPEPPERLVQRVRSLVAGDAPGTQAPAEAMVRAAGVVLSRLLRDGETTRDSALELLSADALATYAFEAQSDEPDALDARCRWAMQHLSRIAGPA